MEDLPRLFAERGWAFTMVMQRELEDDRVTFESRHVREAVAGVVPIDLCPRRKQETKLDEDGGQAAPNDSEPGMAFSDIVEQSGPCQAFSGGRVMGHSPIAFQTVSLVTGSLAEEEKLEPGGEEAPDFGDFCRGERRGVPAPEKPSCEMRPAARHYPWRFLQSTQRIDMGRASRRTAGMSEPQPAQVP